MRYGKSAIIGVVFGWSLLVGPVFADVSSSSSFILTDSFSLVGSTNSSTNYATKGGGGFGARPTPPSSTSSSSSSGGTGTRQRQIASQTSQEVQPTPLATEPAVAEPSAQPASAEMPSVPPVLTTPSPTPESTTPPTRASQSSGSVELPTEAPLLNRVIERIERTITTPIRRETPVEAHESQNLALNTQSGGSVVVPEKSVVAEKAPAATIQEHAAPNKPLVSPKVLQTLRKAGTAVRTSSASFFRKARVRLQREWNALNQSFASQQQSLASTAESIRQQNQLIVNSLGLFFRNVWQSIAPYLPLIKQKIRLSWAPVNTFAQEIINGY